MHTHYLIVNDSSKWQPVKNIVYFVENWVNLIRGLLKPLVALKRKAEAHINASILMISTQQVNFIRILNFQRHQQAHRLQLVTATVNVITQK